MLRTRLFETQVAKMVKRGDLAVARARCGSGPSLVEVMTYRYSEHSEGFLHAGVYRDTEELDLGGWSS